MQTCRSKRGSAYLARQAYLVTLTLTLGLMLGMVASLTTSGPW